VSVASESLVRRALSPLGRLLDFGGRSRRADFWPFMVLLVALYLVGFAGAASGALRFIHPSPVLPLFALVGILVLLAFAAVVRRLHDVGWSGRWMAAYVLVTVAFIAFFIWWRLGIAQAPGGEPPVRLMRIMPLMMIVTAATNGLGLLVFVLCLLEGTAGPNRYGADPKGRSAP